MKKLIPIGISVITIMALLGVSVQFATATYSQCSDGFNNDPAQDNLIDSADPGCHVGGTFAGAYDPTINSEFNATQSGTGTGGTGGGTGGATGFTQCSDGFNNDPAQDNLIDSADPGCHVGGTFAGAYDPSINSEFNATTGGGTGGGGTTAPQCSDGIDNDHDGFTDAADSACHSDGNANNTSSYNPNDNSEFTGCGVNCSNPPPTNHAPVCSAISSQTITVGNTVQFFVSATDQDGDTITYTANNLPAGATFSGQVFSWTPTASQVGIYTVVFTAQDAHSATCNTAVTITVNPANTPPPPVNHPPVCSAIASQTITAGNTIQFFVSATDQDGDALTYAANNLPAGATFAGQTFNWTPTTSQIGIYSVSFSVSDGHGGTCQTSAAIYVNGPQMQNQIVYASTSPSNIVITNNNNNTNTNNNNNTNNGGGGSYNPPVYYPPVYSQPPVYQPPYYPPVSSAPTCSGASYYTVGANNLLQFSFNATDNNSNNYNNYNYSGYNYNQTYYGSGNLTYTAFNLPAGAVFNNVTHFFSWVPNANQVGVYTVTFRATNQAGLYCDLRVTITVTGAPIILPPPVNPPANPGLSIISFNLTNGNPPVVAGASTVANYCGCPVTYQNVNTVGYNCPTGAGATYTGATYTGATYAGVMGADAIITFETDLPSHGYVKYGLAPNSYQYTSPDDGIISTVHRINVGPLEVGRTYYFRAYAYRGSDSTRSAEHSFLELVGASQQIPVTAGIGTGTGTGTSTGSSETTGSASVLATLGALLFSPWFLLIVILALVFLFFMRRRREREVISDEPPLEIVT